jgi:NADPH:quinone reductase-like Zn-dependent oxidoreductase
VHDNTGTRSLTALRPGGLLVNAPTGSWPTMAVDAIAAGRRATGFKVSPDARMLDEISALLNAGTVRVHVDSVFELAEGAAAHRLLEQGHTRGKIVLRVS